MGEEEEEEGGGLTAPTKGEAAAEWCGDGVGGREPRLALAWLLAVVGVFSVFAFLFWRAHESMYAPTHAPIDGDVELLVAPLDEGRNLLN